MFDQPLNAALAPKRSSVLPRLILAVGILVSLALGSWGYVQQTRVDSVVIAVKPIPYGQQISAEDLAMIQVPQRRPAQLSGISNPQLLIGKYAAHFITPNNLVVESDVMASPPTEPVYPNGRQLEPDMVAVPFAVGAIGPITDRDVVNIGYSDPSGDARLCQSRGGSAVSQGQNDPTAEELAAGGDRQPHAYACRLLSQVLVLYIEGEVAYLQVTPYQAHALWALQAQGLQLWGERYGSGSTPLTAVNRLSPADITAGHLTATTDTLKLEAGSVYGPPGIPGSTSGSAIPGSQP